MNPVLKAGSHRRKTTRADLTIIALELSGRVGVRFESLTRGYNDGHARIASRLGSKTSNARKSWTEIPSIGLKF
jgi:hypothetical protein